LEIGKSDRRTGAPGRTAVIEHHPANPPDRQETLANTAKAGNCFGWSARIRFPHSPYPPAEQMQGASGFFYVIWMGAGRSKKFVMIVNRLTIQNQ
jgi:hypothetical protein